MDTTKFSATIRSKLKFYVYRLIDPRTGETFYVGKGQGDRVFAHARDELSAESDTISDKLKQIREIRKDGFNVTHVIHRHGLSEETAMEVEAALIDAYPGIKNIADGQGSDERGAMHVAQIVRQYEAPEIIFDRPAILLNVGRSAVTKSLYEAVRYAWRLKRENAEKAEVVLAVSQGLVIGAFVADKWIEATKANFPGTDEDLPGRWGFVGSEAPKHLSDPYIGHRIPDAMRKRGAAAPVRYGKPTPDGIDLAVS